MVDRPRRHHVYVGGRFPCEVKRILRLVRMIYIVGQPGSGKSTLMAKVTEGLPRVPQDAPVPHDLLVSPVSGAVVGAEIGRRRGVFSGTDALASDVIERAVPWVKTGPYDLLLGEGARLGVARFIRAASVRYAVTLVVLEHDNSEQWRAARSARIGKVQNEAWVKGRRTASLNLAAALRDKVEIIVGHPDHVYSDIAARFRDVT